MEVDSGDQRKGLRDRSLPDTSGRISAADRHSSPAPEPAITSALRAESRVPFVHGRNRLLTRISRAQKRVDLVHRLNSSRVRSHFNSIEYAFRSVTSMFV